MQRRPCVKEKHACINAKSASKNDRGSDGRDAMLFIDIVIVIIVVADDAIIVRE